MQLKFCPLVALASAAVGAVAVDQVSKKAFVPDAKTSAKDVEDYKKYLSLGVGLSALAASYFYGGKMTKGVLLGLGVGSLASQLDTVKTNLLQPVDQKLLQPADQKLK